MQKSMGTVLALTAGLALAAPGAAQEGIAVGETPDAPVLETLDGDSLDLADVVGKKPVLVEFWATWCAVCRALEPRVQEAHDAYGDAAEFLIVAVGVAQDQDDVRRHLTRSPMPGRILWDGRGAATRAFDAPGTGFIVILDAAGKVAYTGTGTDQDLVGALERVVGGG
ncbi:MAG: TlpA disulfide reductase family protein [Longimicrobiales bacterium]